MDEQWDEHRGHLTVAFARKEESHGYNDTTVTKRQIKESDDKCEG